MFSPEATIQSARSSQRNPRRRQRKDSDGLQQQPRRKRSKITEDAFKVPIDAHINGNGNGNGSAIMMNGHAGHVDIDSSLVVVDMPVRDKKPIVKRVHKDDAALYLTKNDSYHVKKLPSFPVALCNGARPFRATALPASGLALALTSSHALAWDYTSLTSPSKVLSLPLPFNLKPSDPLPLGAVVRNGPTNDFGILAIAPSTGKISFWENVDSAEARNHFPQRHQGIDGSLKLYSGELITNVIDIDHAGYILILSSGRLAQLTLRDSQGRPNITATVLNAPSGSSGSFFSFKGLLGNGIRKSIASVKARQSESKGQMEVISATKNGLFQVWDLTWAGQQVYKSEIDAHAQILSAVQSGTPPESRGQQEVHILDFSILESSHASNALELLVLVALVGRNSLEYSLLELDLSENDVAAVTRAIPIRNFQQALIPTEPSATLLLPRSGHTAFIQFEDAVVVASLAEPEESPDAQLLSDSGAPALPFQDSIYFRQDRAVVISGSVVEDNGKKDRHSSILLFVQGYGMIQLDALASVSDSRVTARSKLEQATFFSVVPGNILDFSIKSRYTFAQEEVEAAVIDISSGIVSSTYEHFEKFASSMEDQIRKRAFALHTLITQIQSDYSSISFQVRWELLCDAERVAAALALWNDYQARIKEQQAHPESYPESLLLPHMVQCLHEKFKTIIQPELGETDPVRQWFLRDISKLSLLLPWAWQILRMFYMGESNKERSSVMQRVSEAVEVILTAFETTFNFRHENMELYGLDSHSLKDGILEPGQGYDRLPEFWTSTHNMVSAVRSLVDIGRISAQETFETGIQEDLAMRIAKENPRLVKVCCQLHMERFQWALEQNDEKKKATGRSLKDEWDTKVRPAHIYGLVDIGLATEGMNLAEQYHDMPTLVRLIWDESIYMEENKAAAHSKMEQAECAIKLNRIKERIQRYFTTYGRDWAEAFYSQYISEGRSGQIFTKEHLNQPALTKFFRAQTSRARLGWINEVCGEKQFEVAHDFLHVAGAKQETNSWCKKVELSLAKLALLSNKETKPDAMEEPSFTPRQEQKFVKTSRSLEYVRIQDQLYDRLEPIISEALDDESAVKLLMAEFGQGRLVERPAHQQLLQQGFEHLVQNRVLEPALLIDVLTLMTHDEAEDEVVLALKALASSWQDLNKPARVNLVRLIWKRICIKDNWEEINNTKSLSDEEVQDSLVQTHAGWAFGGLLKLIEQDAHYRVVWPQPFENLLGAGCTDGELCVRFGSEDLRRPIIHDNVMDDDVLKANVEKHNLNEWFVNACTAAQDAHNAMYNPAALEEPELAVADVEYDEGEEVDADVEQSVEVQRQVAEDEDVEMEG
ncbi:Non-repetitive/WGA-negative nucleoporin C-terminal-domain-containing protein [Dendryphion nanum]|uniref:Non-repetitive/WGA-negative nucleoporin C-terminal-domain-containing protein n=1 Tax=Dendryphion nanum TaxID=256645 RepID=A0A9P9DUR2_9PLEO|nr:Non-repetitive/WGA-negative nucleoporin C-terminal-domain-containing protein [Dendryphion nanum]